MPPTPYADRLAELAGLPKRQYEQEIQEALGRYQAHQNRRLSLLPLPEFPDEPLIPLGCKLSSSPRKAARMIREIRVFRSIPTAVLEMPMVTGPFKATLPLARLWSQVHNWELNPIAKQPCGSAPRLVTKSDDERNRTAGPAPQGQIVFPRRPAGSHGKRPLGKGGRPFIVGRANARPSCQQDV